MSRYSPAATLRKEYCPALSVRVSATAEPFGKTSLTAAPATALPCGSVTSPDIAVWARARPDMPAISPGRTAPARRTRMKTHRIPESKCDPTTGSTISPFVSHGDALRLTGESAKRSQAGVPAVGAGRENRSSQVFSNSISHPCYRLPKPYPISLPFIRLF